MDPTSQLVDFEDLCLLLGGGDVLGRYIRPLEVGAAALYLKWRDCPLFMTTCFTAPLVFANLRHLKGRRCKYFQIVH